MTIKTIFEDFDEKFGGLWRNDDSNCRPEVRQFLASALIATLEYVRDSDARIVLTADQLIDKTIAEIKSEMGGGGVIDFIVLMIMGVLCIVNAQWEASAIFIAGAVISLRIDELKGR